MTVNYNEILSALIDGELQGQELEQALHLLHTNENARQQWQRYQLASDVLHGHELAQQSYDLTEKISFSINDEPSYSVTKNNVISLPQQFWKKSINFAIAASVGALAVVGVMSQSENNLIADNVQLAVSENVEPLTRVQTTGKRWTVGEKEVEQRLNTYLVDHNEYTGASGVFSYARVVSYDMGQ